MSTNNQTIIERYAKALFQAGEENHKLGLILTNLEHFSLTLSNYPSLARVMKDPSVPRSKNLQIIQELMQVTQYHPLAVNFLCVLAKERRLNLFSEIYPYFKTLIAQKEQNIKCVVTSAHPLTKKHVNDLQSALKQKAGCTVVLEAVVDPKILGGLVIKLGSILIDSSLKTKLNQFKLLLTRLG